MHLQDGGESYWPKSVRSITNILEREFSNYLTYFASLLLVQNLLKYNWIISWNKTHGFSLALNLT